MQAQDSLTAIPHSEMAQPVPELPVEDVERAQRHYCEKLGFELGWRVPPEGGPGTEIGSVKRPGVVIFLRRRNEVFEPTVHWMFAPQVQVTYEEMKKRGAHITEPLEKKSWGLTQFTVEDLDGNRFYVYCD